jgi:hypothetical protein
MREKDESPKTKYTFPLRAIMIFNQKLILVFRVRFPTFGLPAFIAQVVSYMFLIERVHVIVSLTFILPE